MSEFTGDALGSTLWMLATGKNDQNTRTAIVTAIEDSLAWLVEDSVAESVEVEIDELLTNRVNFLVNINDFSDDRNTAFNFLWDVHRSRIGNGQANN